jgi:hypothetical protein
MQSEILADIQWKGNFGRAVEHNGSHVCAIAYQLFSDNVTGQGAGYVYAVFIDDKFAKFVRPPPPRPEDMEVVDVEGTPSSRPRPRRLDDLSQFVRIHEADPADLAALEKEVKARPDAPSSIDPGLTIAFVLMGGLRFKATEQQHGRNAKLRDQFNAGRLQIGMSVEEVEKTLRSKAIFSGITGSDDLRVYGSNEWFNIYDTIHFTNVLVLFRDNKARLICSAPPGADWLNKLRDCFIDFPR